MSRYGQAIRYDLRRELGVDAGELWRSRRWRELLDYIDQLPQNTQTRQAMLSDPQHIAMIQEAREKYGLEPSPVSMAEYSPEVARLDTLIDAVQGQTFLLAKANGAKGAKPPKPQPRPGAMTGEMEHRHKMAESKKVADRFMRRTVE